MDTWAHLLVTSHGPSDDVKVYINGVNVGATLTSPAALAGNTPNTWVVGNAAYSGGLWTTSLNGQIDEYSMWDVAFTDADVTGEPFTVGGRHRM